MVKAGEPSTRADEDVEGVDASAAPMTLEQYQRMSAAVIQHYYPSAAWCKVLVGIPDGYGIVKAIIPVPLTVDQRTPEGRVLFFLSKFPAGEWVKGRTIAAEVELEYGGGTFGGLMSKLVKEGKLTSHQTQGYRLKRT